MKPLPIPKTDRSFAGWKLWGILLLLALPASAQGWDHGDNRWRPPPRGYPSGGGNGFLPGWGYDYGRRGLDGYYLDRRGCVEDYRKYGWGYGGIGGYVWPGWSSRGEEVYPGAPGGWAYDRGKGLGWSYGGDYFRRQVPHWWRNRLSYNRGRVPPWWGYGECY